LNANVTDLQLNLLTMACLR